MSSETSVQMTKPDDCSICFEPLDNNVDDRTIVILRRCSHQFHLDCIGSAFNSKNRMECPLCLQVENGRWLSGNDNVHSSVNAVASPAVIGVASSLVNEALVSRVMYYYDQIGVPPPRFEGPIVIRENYIPRPPPRTPYVPHLITRNGDGGDGGSIMGRGSGHSSRGDGGSSSGRDNGSRGDGASSSGGDGGSGSREGGESSSGGGRGRSHG